LNDTIVGAKKFRKKTLGSTRILNARCFLGVEIWKRRRVEDVNPVRKRKRKKKSRRTEMNPSAVKERSKDANGGFGLGYADGAEGRCFCSVGKREMSIGLSHSTERRGSLGGASPKRAVARHHARFQT